jgi:hypothetical protein
MIKDKTRLFIVLAVIVMAFCLALLLAATVYLFTADNDRASAASVDDVPLPDADSSPFTLLPAFQPHAAEDYLARVS